MSLTFLWIWKGVVHFVEKVEHQKKKAETVAKYISFTVKLHSLINTVTITDSIVHGKKNEEGKEGLSMKLLFMICLLGDDLLQCSPLL